MSRPPKDLDLSPLSADYRAAFEAQQDQILALVEHNKRLENLVKELQRALYGKKSERLSPDERQLCFEDLETAISEVQEVTDATLPGARRHKPSVKRNLGNLPEDLPRIERLVEPESRLCPCGCGEMTKIGEGEADQKTIQ